MEDIIVLNNNIDNISKNDEAVISEDLVASVEENLIKNYKTATELAAYTMPIVELATLGSSFASLLPVFRTVTSTTVANVSGLYRVANAGAGDVLKVAKDGLNWGALKTPTGGSKLAKLEEVTQIVGTDEAVAAINPALVVVAVALFSIEKELGAIKELSNKIVSVLQIQQESKILADIQTLEDILKNYKYNWDNKLSMASNHQIACDIKRSAREYILTYNKEIKSSLEGRKFFNTQSRVQSELNKLIKDYQYYRTAIYVFSMASLAEILLDGNFKEELIQTIKAEISSLTIEYRQLYSETSLYLEKLSKSTIEKMALHGIGTAEKAVGRLINKIPLVERGQLDDQMIEQGTMLQGVSRDIVTKAVLALAKVKDPSTAVFLNKLDDINRIYNYTSDILFDENKIYLIA